MNVKWWFHPCQRHAADLSLLAAGTLAEADRVPLAEHLAQCPACRARLAELKNLAGRLTQDGENLPQIEPPPSLRRRWMTEVRLSTQPSIQPEAPLLPVWLTGRRLAWGGIGAMWMLILFFRFSGPDAPRPTVMATPPTSLRQILLALRTDLSEPSFSAPAESQPQNKPSVPDALPPRSERPDNHSTRNPSIA